MHTPPREKATRENILKALTWVKQNARLMIWSSRLHRPGRSVANAPATLPSIPPSRIAPRMPLASGDIEHAMEKLRSQHFVAFLDVNFKGFDIGKEQAPDPNLGNFYREFLGKDDDKAPGSAGWFYLANTALKPSLDLENTACSRPCCWKASRARPTAKV